MTLLYRRATKPALPCMLKFVTLGLTLPGGQPSGRMMYHSYYNGCALKMKEENSLRNP